MLILFLLLKILFLLRCSMNPIDSGLKVFCWWILRMGPFCSPMHTGSVFDIFIIFMLKNSITINSSSFVREFSCNHCQRLIWERNPTLFFVSKEIFLLLNTLATWKQDSLFQWNFVFRLILYRLLKHIQVEFLYLHSSEVCNF